MLRLPPVTTAVCPSSRSMTSSMVGTGDGNRWGRDMAFGTGGDPRPASRTWWCPEPDLNRHAREGAARFKLAVSAFHHPGGRGAPLRAVRAYRDASLRQGARWPDVVLFY